MTDIDLGPLTDRELLVLTVQGLNNLTSKVDQIQILVQKHELLLNSTRYGNRNRRDTIIMIGAGAAGGGTLLKAFEALAKLLGS